MKVNKLIKMLEKLDQDKEILLYIGWWYLQEDWTYFKSSKDFDDLEVVEWYYLKTKDEVLFEEKRDGDEEKHRIAQKKYREKNKDILKAKDKIYRENNKDKIRDRNKVWQEKKKAELKAKDRLIEQLIEESRELKEKLEQIKEAYIRFEDSEKEYNKWLWELDKLIMNR